MDTLTHALSGVLVATAIRRPTHPKRDHAWLIAVALAGAFPDIDYLLILYDPMGFLNLHRGPTHSLVLLPLWALLLSLPLKQLLTLPWLSCFAACALGLLMHILGDWVTLYGTKLFYPFNDHAYTLNISFDINPWIAVVVVVGCLIALMRKSRLAARLSLVLIAVLLAGQAALAREALAVAIMQAQTIGQNTNAVRVLPQPLSPFHWGLLVSDTANHHLAHLDLLAEQPVNTQSSFLLLKMAAAYRPQNTLSWSDYATPNQTEFSRKAWSQPELAAFRQFAQAPALVRIDHTPEPTCAWFTDLRHALPALPPAFRFGLCRVGDGASWRAYRLRYFTEDGRQGL